MKIESIELENFRQYKDDHIEFTTEGTAINVIVARNGKGKSNILNAITWCLYKEEVHSDENKGYPLINTNVLDEMEEGDRNNVSVELEMIDEDGKRHNIERSKSFKKKDELTTVNEEFFYTREEDGDMKPVPKPEQMISRKMPEGIKKYFFFDGENIKDYVTGGSKEVEPAIRNISQIDVLSTLKRHLNEMKGRIIDRKDELNEDIEELREEIEVLKDEIDELDQKREEKKKRKDEIKEQIGELENKLAEKPNVGELQNDRKELEEEEEKKEGELSELKAEKLEKLFNDGPIILAREAIEETVERTDEKIDKGEIPPKFKREYLEGLIEEEEQCICGRDLDEEHKEKLRKLLTEVTEVSELYNSLMSGRSTMRDTISDLDGNFLQEQNKLNDRLNTITSRLDKIDEEKEDIKVKLRGSDDKQIRKWEEDLSDKKDQLEKVSKKIGNIKPKMDRKKKDKKKKNQKIRKNIRKEERNEEYTRKYSLCDEGEQSLEAIEEEIIEEIRGKIENKTQSKFSDMMWKNRFETVEVDQNFSISVKDKEGREALGSLSKGEKQTLAYSFTFALNEVSGFKTPLVIDSSLGRIDGPIDVKFAESLPEMIGDRQLILLVKNKDYRDDVRKVLKENAGKEYNIDFNNSVAKVQNYE